MNRTQKLDCQKRDINGKSVFVFESHETALLPWAEYRRSLSKPPLLLTLDHHTDTREAFTNELSRDEQIREMDVEQIIERSVSEARKIDYNSETSVATAVQRLKNDEHIDAAIQSGILNAAFVICYSETQGTTSEEESYYASTCDRFSDNYQPERTRKPLPPRPHKYEIPYGRIFIIGSSRGFNWDTTLCTGVNILRKWYSALESKWLSAKLSFADEMIRYLGVSNLIDENFILDIDLDYFHSERSLSPNDCSTFHNLIRRAGIITIARETKFVGAENFEIEAEGISVEAPSADEALKAIIEHIREATKIS